MNLAVISLGGESSLAIAKEGKSYFRESENLDIRKIEVHSTPEKIRILYGGEELEDYACVYIRGSHKYSFLQRSMSEALIDRTYMPFKPSSFTLSHNKFLTLLKLQQNKVLIPTTYLAATLVGAKKILEQVNYPIIMKIPEGSQGKGVLFADSFASATSILDTLEIFRQPYIIQEYIETDATDIRAIVVGDKVVASYRRKALGQEIRANIHLGSVGQECKLDAETEGMALRAARAVSADVCAVDMLESNKTSVIEVNLSPGLKGMEKATGKNLAKIIAEFLHLKATEFKEGKKKADYSKIVNELNNKEILTNLNIKGGIIKLPEVITKITKFTGEDEVVMVAEKGKLVVKKIM